MAVRLSVVFTPAQMGPTAASSANGGLLRRRSSAPSICSSSTTGSILDPSPGVPGRTATASAGQRRCASDCSDAERKPYDAEDNRLWASASRLDEEALLALGPATLPSSEDIGGPSSRPRRDAHTVCLSDADDDDRPAPRAEDDQDDDLDSVASFVSVDTITVMALSAASGTKGIYRRRNGDVINGRGSFNLEMSRIFGRERRRASLPSSIPPKFGGGASRPGLA